MVLKICLISPEIIGPHKNGGIGTHVFFLAKLLSADSQRQLTILYTGAIGSETVEYWRKHFKDKVNARFVHESELLEIFQGNLCGARLHLVRSQKIYHWLKDQDFDICHFQDYDADGFVSIQAKRTGQAFQQTLLTCMAHSSHAWAMEAMQMFPPSVDQLILDYAERYCMQFADLIISPSEYMLQWMEENHWQVGANRKVLPCLIDWSKSLPPVRFGKDHIIFFGRLETRKGLELFLNALRRLESRLKQYSDQVKITFLGRISSTAYQDTRQALKDFFERCSDLYYYEILDDKSQPEALAFLAEHADALVVTPSLIDNFPCAILECVELGLNVISSNIGGIPEIVGEDRLFTPNVNGLVQKIEECFREGVKPLDKKYSLTKTRELWKNLHQALADQKCRLSQVTLVEQSSPFISVCIPYYNCGEYLPDLLSSLNQQTYSNFEVIVVNDGSTDLEACRVFETMQQQYDDKNWVFVSKPNGGLGNARNFSTLQAKGDYFVFVDADNAAEPEMLERMVKGIQCAGVDALTSYFRAFDTDHGPFAKLYTYAYTPVGNCSEAGIYENVFGDANFIVRRSVFEALGGFRESRTHTWEDWEFLARLSLSGYSVDVIPEFLFLYRHRSDSLTRTTSGYSNHLFAVSAYFENQPLWLQRLLLNSIGTSKNRVASSVDLRVPHLQNELTKSRKAAKQARNKLEELEVKLEQAMERIEAMETSKFWRIRKGWFRFKKMLRLPSNE